MKQHPRRLKCSKRSPPPQKFTCFLSFFQVAYNSGTHWAIVGASYLRLDPVISINNDPESFQYVSSMVFRKKKGKTSRAWSGGVRKKEQQPGHNGVRWITFYDMSSKVFRGRKERTRESPECLWTFFKPSFVIISGCLCVCVCDVWRYYNIGHIERTVEPGDV